MGDAPTPISLPGDLPWPITLTRLLVSPGQSVRRGDRMLEYSFLSSSARRDRARRASDSVGSGADESGVEGNDMVGSWECPIEGEVDGWAEGIKPGKVIEERHASKPVVRVAQPCTHPVQLHGMCGICGADLTTDDYMTRPAEKAGPSRYPGGFEIAHDAMGVTVSTSEARRLETLTRDTLLWSRRLSLIVDLDQTIIHTTVDPTVGEWMAEISSEEESGAEEAAGETVVPTSEDGGGSGDGGDGGEGDVKKEGAERVEGETTTPPGSPKASKAKAKQKEKNPNADALQDVARFQLADDIAPGSRSGSQPVRWYYTKPRPGLQPFLTAMSKLYELHVYTMGTRSYADAICRVIDPDGKIFGGRILSRDESGSMSSKSLIRLFPTDHSMVVVIDDRSDVWGDCPNLVKVIPYDFFVGIGDINGAFLPPQPKSGPTSPHASLTTPPATPDSSAAASSPPPETPPSLPSSSAPAPLPDSLEGTDAPSTEEGLAIRAKLLDEMSQARPLAKLQQELEKDESGEAVEASTTERENDVTVDGEANVEGEQEGKEGDEQSIEESASVAPRGKPLLNAHDYELDRIGKILSTVHKGFYRAYDARQNKDASAPLPLGCDVELIIPDLKSRVLDGCVVLFSAVIPRNQEPEASDIWLSAESFGARCVRDLTPSVTHVVAAAYGTEKTVRATRMGIKVVWLGWLQDSMARWKRMDEGGYLASEEAGEKENKMASGEGVTLGNEVGERTEEGTRTDGAVDEERGESGPQSGDEDGVRNGMARSEVIEKQNQGEGDGEGVGVGVAIEQDTQDTLDPDPLGDVDWDNDDHEWNEEDDREMEEFLRGAGESDFEGDGEGDGEDDATDDGASDAGSVVTASASGRKRVRYADEESLPLESFKDPSPPMRPESPPKKRPRALLLPPAGGDDVPPENRFVVRSRNGTRGGGVELVVEGGGGGGDDEVQAYPEGGSEGDEGGENGEGVDGTEEGHGASLVDAAEDGDDDDEFAQMLLESVDAQDD